MATLGGRVRNVLVLARDADSGALLGEGCDDNHADYSGSTWFCPVFLWQFLGCLSISVLGLTSGWCFALPMGMANYDDWNLCTHSWLMAYACDWTYYCIIR
ncbi:hypothetical protein GUJ93_ZPchr0006g42089 [Zizania palustris]|uniref:Uncharacterized protein n=1 Tax=Zizania palustris TaxID=103762 RepID=A0A8J5T622_ZIZPA|nr:hypothetical protein GUJ93_ZPchr0006g42089 [Zizania palustris]